MTSYYQAKTAWFGNSILSLENARRVPLRFPLVIYPTHNTKPSGLSIEYYHDVSLSRFHHIIRYHTDCDVGFHCPGGGGRLWGPRDTRKSAMPTSNPYSVYSSSSPGSPGKDWGLYKNQFVLCERERKQSNSKFYSINHKHSWLSQALTAQYATSLDPLGS